MREEGAHERGGRPAAPRRLSCREVLERSGRAVEVLGPALEDEALAVVD